jgi:exopolysaccharide biosynthesis polyprenyl glycosylphosphotransferase
MSTLPLITTDQQHVAVGQQHRALRLGHPRAWSLASLALDTAMLAAAAFAAELGSGAAGVPALNVFWDITFAAVVLGTAATRGMYRLGLWRQAIDDMGRIAIAVGVATMVVITLRALHGDGSTLAPSTLRVAAFAIVYVGAGRIALYWSLANAYAHGDLVRRTLIVGAGRVGRVVARRLLEKPTTGLLPVAFVDDDPRLDAGEELELPLAGALRELDRAIEENDVSHVIVAFCRGSEEELLELVNGCEARGVSVSIVPRLYEKMPRRIDVDHLGGVTLVSARPTSPAGWQFAVKYAIDRVVAAVAILLLSPVFIAASVAVWISMGRPLFFRQVRVGRDGKPFEILKFRSMRDATPEELELMRLAAQNGNAPGGVEGVDRRTLVGTILRKTSIDELPQLFNVLKGEMSLVGPRPERPEFVEKFESEVYRYADRHRAKAGITGWAQVHGLRGKTSISDRAEWDNYYIENFALGLDLKILFLTAAAVVGAFKSVE